MSVGGNSQLTIDSISNIGPHYARTLREWRNSFLEKFDSVIEPALKKEHPDVMSGEDGRYEIEVFKRKWICKLSFSVATGLAKTELPSSPPPTFASADY